jgi:Bacterial Ig-like domain (group 3)/Abnormal spindle-like microcephaly-assoc'd, ASPM-SPD-2-Hydin
VNGDGKPDLLVLNVCADFLCEQSSGSAVSVLINISTFPTTTALSSSANPSTFGQSVKFTAAVTQQFGKGTPTGTVTFLDGTTNLGSPTLSSSGVATLTTSTLAVGTHSITATYNGDSNFGSSTSPVLSQVVQGAIALLSPTSLNFGNKTVGDGQGYQTVTLTNTGNIALTITSIAVNLSNGGYTQINTCGTSVAAGASCTYSLTWNPAKAGTMTGSITFTDNAPGSPQTVSLTGVGVTPSAKLSPTSLTFATQVVFTTSAAQTVTLSNTGLGILSITKVSVSGPFTQTNTCGSQVAAGASCTFSVKFKPTKSGTSSGSVSITDNATGSPQKITLTGTGTDIQFTPTSLNFGNQPVGTKSLAKKITLSNKASVNVSITSISITGTNKGDFAQTNTCGTSVKAGASCSITVTFTPAAKGKRTASVSVSDDGGGSPQTVGLSGTGT